MSLWQAWRLSQTYRQLPSEVYRIADPVAAFYFDRAVASFGSSVENDLEEASKDKKGKAAEAARSVVLSKWLGTPMKFATPVPTKRR